MDAKPKKKGKRKGMESRGTWSLRPPDDVRELMSMAERATGESRQGLIFKLIRDNISGVVDQTMRSQEDQKEDRESARKQIEALARKKSAAEGLRRAARGDQTKN